MFIPAKVPGCQVLGVLGILACCIQGQFPHPCAPKLLPVRFDAQLILRTVEGSPGVTSLLAFLLYLLRTHRAVGKQISQPFSCLISGCRLGARPFLLAARASSALMSTSPRSHAMAGGLPPMVKPRPPACAARLFLPASKSLRGFFSE